MTQFNRYCKLWKSILQFDWMFTRWWCFNTHKMHAMLLIKNFTCESCWINAAVLACLHTTLITKAESACISTILMEEYAFPLLLTSLQTSPLLPGSNLKGMLGQPFFSPPPQQATSTNLWITEEGRCEFLRSGMHPVLHTMYTMFTMWPKYQI